MLVRLLGLTLILCPVHLAIGAQKLQVLPENSQKPREGEQFAMDDSR
jgi:hypothetical protein